MQDIRRLARANLIRDQVRIQASNPCCMACGVLIPIEALAYRLVRLGFGTPRSGSAWRVGESTVSANGSTSRPIAWGQCIVTAVGALLLLLGVTRFILADHFGFIDLLYCCLAVIPMALLLLVFDYVLHHAKLVAVIPLMVALTLVVSSAAFDVALGLAVIGAIAGPMFTEWKDERRRLRLLSEREGENSDRQ